MGANKLNFIWFYFMLTAFCAGSLDAQEIGFLSSWNIGAGVSFNNIRSASFVEITEGELQLATDLRNGGATRGLHVSFSNFRRINRRIGVVSELKLMHSRKRGYFEEELSQNEIIYRHQGSIHFSNLLIQLFVAPRYQFGRFNRYFLAMGPYIDQNIWNFSTNEGYKVSYFDQVEFHGAKQLVALDHPREVALSQSSAINPIDFGGMLSLGTFLALPGKNMLQVEFRYSRGAFRISDIPGVRQNRFFMVLSYAITKPIGDSYLKYMPY